MEQRQTACKNPEDRAQEKLLILHKDKLHARIQRTEHRSKLLIQHEDKNAHTNPANRAQEQVANTARKRLAKERPGVLKNET
jgi:hypothetical protein